jgi:hypothetical protein
MRAGQDEMKMQNEVVCDRRHAFETRDFYLACFSGVPDMSCWICALKGAGRYLYSRIARIGATM